MGGVTVLKKPCRNKTSPLLGAQLASGIENGTVPVRCRAVVKLYIGEHYISLAKQSIPSHFYLLKALDLFLDVVCICGSGKLASLLCLC